MEEGYGEQEEMAKSCEANGACEGRLLHMYTGTLYDTCYDRATYSVHTIKTISV